MANSYMKEELRNPSAAFSSICICTMLLYYSMKILNTEKRTNYSYTWQVHSLDIIRRQKTHTFPTDLFSEPPKRATQPSFSSY